MDDSAVNRTGVRGGRVVVSSEQTENVISKLFQQLLPIVRRLFDTHRNFKVTVNVSAGQKFRIEVIEYFDEM